MALKHKINDVSQFTRLLNERAARAHADNPTAPLVEFVLFEPPPKATLYAKTLDGEAMRDDSFGCASTYAVSSCLQKNGRVVVRDHKLTGQPPHHSCNPRLISQSKGEKTIEASEDIAAGRPDEDGWRRSFRKVEPEKEDNNLGKLMAQYEDIATKKLRSSLPLSGRSKTKDHALIALERQQSEKKAADAAVRKAIKDKQKVESSSSSSDASESSSSSSSSSSGS